MKVILIGVLTLTSNLLFAEGASQYKGEEHRSIKSLSSQEIASLKAGQGMGFAKVAELNHYPGPKHVLEQADKLGLSPSQAAETKALFDEMQRSAIALGEDLVDAEMALDRSFASATISAESLESALQNIGRIRAQLRYVHLEAHLRQKRLLTGRQVAKYDEIRGYQGGNHDHRGHTKSRN